MKKLKIITLGIWIYCLLLFGLLRFGESSGEKIYKMHVTSIKNSSGLKTLCEDPIVIDPNSPKEAISLLIEAMDKEYKNACKEKDTKWNFTPMGVFYLGRVSIFYDIKSWRIDDL